MDVASSLATFCHKRFGHEKQILSQIFFLLHCEKNADGTKNLILKGQDLQLRIYRRLEDCDIVTLTHFLTAYPVVHLDLCYNRITDIGLKTFVLYYLTTEPKLEYLSLKGCDITQEGIKYLCHEISFYEFSIQNLRLSGNKFGAEGGKELAKLLDKNTHVEYLDVAETDQTLESVQYFLTILHKGHGHNKTIKVIDLSRPILDFNRYNYNSGYLAEKVAIMLSCNDTLIELHLQKCQLDAHDFELLLIGLKENHTLLFLDIGLNKIGDYGIELLAKYLKNRPHLLGLNVSANGIGDSGARALSLGMSFSRIRLLDITHNKINDKGILDILNSIKKSTQMRMLYLWGNNICHAACKTLKRMFKSGVLNQNHVDVVVYEVDKILYAAYLRCDRYKHFYYCELDYGITMPIKIKKNPPPEDKKYRIDFKHHEQILGFNSVGPTQFRCTCCACNK